MFFFRFFSCSYIFWLNLLYQLNYCVFYNLFTSVNKILSFASLRDIFFLILFAIRQLCWILCIVIGCFLCNGKSLESYSLNLYSKRNLAFMILLSSRKIINTSLIQKEYFLLFCLPDHRWINSHWIKKHHVKYQNTKLWNLRHLEFIKEKNIQFWAP